MIYCKSEEIESERIDDETLVFYLNDGTFHKFNKIGSDIWDLIDCKRTETQIIQELLGKYDVDEKIITKDIRNWCKKALKRGFIKTMSV